MAMHAATLETERNVSLMVRSLDEKMDRLVSHLIQKSDTTMIPVAALKWIIIFLLVFNFAFIFGIPATEKMAHRVSTFFSEHEAPKE